MQSALNKAQDTWRNDFDRLALITVSSAARNKPSAATVACASVRECHPTARGLIDWRVREIVGVMRGISAGIALCAAVLWVAQAAGGVAQHGRSVAFGGIGPHGAYTVRIAADGYVQATGNGGLTRVGAPQLAPTQLAALDRNAALDHFGSFPDLTRCTGATAASTTWIRIGSKKVTVVGICLPAYQRLFKAFVAATRFYALT